MHDGHPGEMRQSGFDQRQLTPRGLVEKHRAALRAGRRRGQPLVGLLGEQGADQARAAVVLDDIERRLGADGDHDFGGVDARIVGGVERRNLDLQGGLRGAQALADAGDGLLVGR